jgi:hypothetical protein
MAVPAYIQWLEPVTSMNSATAKIRFAWIFRTTTCKYLE